MKLYFESIKMHIKSALEYKKSFIITFISQFFVFFTYYFIIIALFNNFDNIRGFTVYEVLLTFGVIQFGFAFNEIFARGFDVFEKLIISGDFDRLLIRPRAIILQILCSRIDIVKISRLLQAIIILVIAILNLNIDWNFLRVITLLLMLLSAVIIFFSIFVFTASYCFLTIQGLEVRNVFTDGGKHMAQYPISIFKRGFVFIFTFIIPYAFVNYYPLLYLLGRVDNKIYAFSPLVVFVFLIPALLSFKLGMKKYKSTGS
jgi:ABC-2 type transport system permease protein